MIHNIAGILSNLYSRKSTRFLFIAAILNLSYLSSVDAQTRSHINHYPFNYYYINPAVAGIEDYIDLRSSIRSQWSGLEGAPESLVLAVNGNIESGRKVHPANPLKPQMPEIEGYTIDLDGYNARPHHGVGGIVIADRIGPFSHLRINGSYAYHIPLNKKYRLSAGLSLGLIHNRLDRNKITLQDQNDIAVTGEKYTNLNPDVGFGMWFYSKSLFVGVSGNQLFKYNQAFGEYIQSEKESYRQFTFNGGYKFFIHPSLIITPSVMVRWLSPQPIVVDYNVVFSFLNRLSIGCTYRNSNEFVLLSRFIASPVVEFGYAFDFGTASVDRYNYGSHEFYLGLRLKNKYKVLCPVNL